MRMPFDEIKIADFTWWIAGPLTTKTFADYGATVVSIESAAKPGGLRVSMPYKDNKPGLDRSGFYAFYNANKYSLSLNLDNAWGREVAKKLISWSDIVVENFNPGVMEKWDFRYEDLEKIKPDIIMLRTSNQGQTGPFSKLGGLGLQLNALGGFVNATGWQDREPLSLMFAYSDYFVSHFAVASIIAALDYRRRSGKGLMIDLSQNEACMQFLAPYLLDYTVNGNELERKGNRSPNAVPHNVYPCKGYDNWCAIAVFTDEDWYNFCKAIDNPTWTDDNKFSTFSNRKNNEDELDKLIGSWTINYTTSEVMDLMQSFGIAAGIVQKGNEIYNDLQLKEYNIFWKLKHKVIGDFTHMGQPAILSKTPAQARIPSPCLGENTEYVCKEILNFTDEEYIQLLLDGAFGF